MIVEVNEDPDLQSKLWNCLENELADGSEPPESSYL
jgi:hypothetical protein